MLDERSHFKYIILRQTGDWVINYDKAWPVIGLCAAVSALTCFDKIQESNQRFFTFAQSLEHRAIGAFSGSAEPV
ncbi:hypothetical protein D3C80_1491910 [compost metagenome]